MDHPSPDYKRLFLEEQQRAVWAMREEVVLSKNNAELA